ncbi:hypothetical protein ACW5R3_05160 [Bizionia sp. KMM 8389]
MKYLKFLIPLLVLACSSDKVIQLPEVSYTEFQEVLDVSPAYIFYDSTATNGLELNRKNLIISTNWLVNIDNRLTLKQVIPQVQFLQNKKRNAEMHKNEDAKNYFSCHDTSVKNLGFIEFTDTYYHLKDSINSTEKALKAIPVSSLPVRVESLDVIKIPFGENIITMDQLINDLKNSSESTATHLILHLSETLSFQDYMGLKSDLLQVDSTKLILDSNEFIY